MQDAITASPWLQYLIGVLFGAGGLAAFYKLFLERKKPAAEIHESEARVKLTIADADSKDVDSSIKAADVIIRSAQKISEQAQAIARLEVERDNWRDRFRMVEKELERFRHGGNGKAK